MGQRPLESKASVVMGLELEHKQKSKNLSLTITRNYKKLNSSNKNMSLEEDAKLQIRTQAT